MHLLIVSFLACVSTPPAVAEASLVLDGEPLAFGDCWPGCTEAYPCGGDLADLHGADIDSYTVRTADAHLRLWDDQDGTGGLYYDGPCVEWEEQWVCGGIFFPDPEECGWADVCIRELDVDFGLCWSGEAEFTKAQEPGQIDGVYAMIDAELACEADGYALSGTVTCKHGDYPE